MCSKAFFLRSIRRIFDFEKIPYYLFPFGIQNINNERKRY